MPTIPGEFNLGSTPGPADSKSKGQDLASRRSSAVDASSTQISGIFMCPNSDSSSLSSIRDDESATSTHGTMAPGGTQTSQSEPRRRDGIDTSDGDTSPPTHGTRFVTIRGNNPSYGLAAGTTTHGHSSSTKVLASDSSVTIQREPRSSPTAPAVSSADTRSHSAPSVPTYGATAQAPSLASQSRHLDGPSPDGGNSHVGPMQFQQPRTGNPARAEPIFWSQRDLQGDQSQRFQQDFPSGTYVQEIGTPASAHFRQTGSPEGRNTFVNPPRFSKLADPRGTTPRVSFNTPDATLANELPSRNANSFRSSNVYRSTPAVDLRDGSATRFRDDSLRDTLAALQSGMNTMSKSLNSLVSTLAVNHESQAPQSRRSYNTGPDHSDNNIHYNDTSAIQPDIQPEIQFPSPYKEYTPTPAREAFFPPKLLPYLPESVRYNFSPKPSQTGNNFKSIDFPTFDGELSSNQYLFVRRVTTLRDHGGIPDTVICQKLFQILSGTAGLWHDNMLSRDQTYDTWNAWARAIIMQFSTPDWFRRLRRTLRDHMLSKATEASPTEWAVQHFNLLTTIHPTMSESEQVDLFCDALPGPLSELLNYELEEQQARGAEPTINFILSSFERQVRFYKVRYQKAQTPYTGKPANSANSASKTSQPFQRSQGYSSQQKPNNDNNKPNPRKFCNTCKRWHPTSTPCQQPKIQALLEDHTDDKNEDEHSNHEIHQDSLNELTEHTGLSHDQEDKNLFDDEDQMECGFEPLPFDFPQLQINSLGTEFITGKEANVELASSDVEPARASLMPPYSKKGIPPTHLELPCVKVYFHNKSGSFNMMLDSGAAVSTMSESIFRLLYPNGTLEPYQGSTLLAFGHSFRPLGSTTLDVILDHRQHPLTLRVTFLILEDAQCSTPLLLGWNFIRAYGLDVVSSGSTPYLKVGFLEQRFPLKHKDVNSCSSIQTISHPPRGIISEGPTTAPRLTLPNTVRSKHEKGPATTQPYAFRDVVSSLTLNPTLTARFKDRLTSVFHRFPMALAHGTHQLGACPEYQLEIDLQLPDIFPTGLCKRAYPASPKAISEMDKQLDELLALGVIRSSSSPFSAPGLMVFKPKPRLVVDYKILNSFTIGISHPMPKISEAITHLRDAKYISALDLNKGFHQIRVHPDHVNKTAFATHRGLFEYLRMPFGLKNAPAIFQRTMESIFSSEIRKGWLIIYIDDIVIASLTEDDHIEHLATVLSLLDSAQLTVNPKKCRIGFTELHALGHKVSGLQMCISDNHVAAVENWPAPRDIKALRQWLGFAGFQSSKIPNFSQTAKPLYELLKKDTPFQWTIDRQRAFEKLKKLLLEMPLVSLPITDVPYELYLDACFEGLGAALLQKQGLNTVPICFISRQLKDSETRYGATQLECLALVWALEKLYFYLDGANFTVYTDCQAIISLLNLKTPSRHMLRWQLAIQEFRNGMTIRHRPGKLNVLADALSRAALPNTPDNPAADIPTVTHSDQAPDLLPIGSLTLVSIHNEIFDTIKDGYSQHSDFSRICAALSNNIDRPSDLMSSLPPNLSTDFQSGRFLMLDGLLYRKTGLASTLVIADTITRTKILESCHDELSAGHLAEERTLATVRRIAWWPSLASDVSNFVASCEICQRARRATGKLPGLLQRIESPSQPWEIINMDFVTGLPPAGKEPFNAIMVIVDRMSKMTFFIPTTDKTNAHDSAILFWHSCWSRVGVPRVIISDRDPKFTSDFWRSFHSLLGTRLAFSTAHHPQTDGLAERNIMTLEDMIRRFVGFGTPFHDPSGNNRDWVSILPALEMAYNSTVHKVTKMTPFELERGYLPLLPRDFIAPIDLPLKINPQAQDFKQLLDLARSRAAECVTTAFDYAKKRWDKSHTTLSLKPGDQVMISTRHFEFLDTGKKLKLPFIGPFTVNRLLGPNAVQVNLTKEHRRKHPVFPISLVKRYTPTNPDKFPDRNISAPPLPELIDGEDEWEIEAIVDSRGSQQSREYRVRWKGFPPEQDTWLSEVALRNAPDLLQEYLSSKNKWTPTAKR